MLPFEKKAVEAFIDVALRAGKDRVGVAKFSNEISLVQDLSPDFAVVKSRLNAITFVRPPGYVGGGGNGNSGTATSEKCAGWDFVIRFDRPVDNGPLAARAQSGTESNFGCVGRIRYIRREAASRCYRGVRPRADPALRHRNRRLRLRGCRRTNFEATHLGNRRSCYFSEEIVEARRASRETGECVALELCRLILRRNSRGCVDRDSKSGAEEKTSYLVTHAILITEH